ncbi:MAG: glucosamine 6-phosphate synthetase [Flavobacteriaceae bacterium]|nr:glucosamine 6-phosphate synthetase [Flavobacteriaceae bacterium]
MCGIFGVFIKDSIITEGELASLAKHAQERGSDSSGLMLYRNGAYETVTGDIPISKLLAKTDGDNCCFVAGHSRLATNGTGDNQPLMKENTLTIHNGIICNTDQLWKDRESSRELAIDTEIIPVLIKEEKAKGKILKQIEKSLFTACEGVISAAVLDPKIGELLLFSNNGSLYTAIKNDGLYFASESWPLKQVGCENIEQLHGSLKWSLPSSGKPIKQTTIESRERSNLLPQFNFLSEEEKLLNYDRPDLKRCSCCVLPETMPYIRFDSDDVCNYCHNYKTRNQPKPFEMLEELVAPYRRKGSPDCIVPFSGGRDSSYGLHLIVKELGMNPITYTYDWGMVTDLGRRNISRMCSALGVENIIIAADIELKRKNIRKNLSAWLKKPHLGMMALLTAGDKHFFRHVETVKAQTGISLNLWGVNPLEVTHFKTGFLGMPPSFEQKRVYTNGLIGQFNYHRRRFWQMLANPSYLNASLFDTLSGEYWRSIHKKSDYFHIFDFWEWDEKRTDEVLASYNWEFANDTPTSWRIGDATAAFYNYVYYTVAGFTEHDTFRSNQIREGALTRDQALELIAVENQPRYESIKWYLDAVGLDFKEVIECINRIPKLYN